MEDTNPVKPMYLRIHFRVLNSTTEEILNFVLEKTREVFSQVGVQVLCMSSESMDKPDLETIYVNSDGSMTPDQEKLFNNRDGVGGSEIVVYFVTSTIPVYGGFAAHPAGKPGLVITNSASQWTLAHEIGHVLSLKHVNDTKRLMMNGTASITDPPPDILAAELTSMLASGLITSV